VGFYLCTKLVGFSGAHCPVRTRKVLLGALPAKPHVTLIAPKNPPPRPWMGLKKGGAK